MLTQLFTWMKKGQPSKRRGVRPNPSMLQVQELESRCLLSGSGVGAFIEGPAEVVRGHEAVFELRAEFPDSGGEFGLGSPIMPLTQVGDLNIWQAESHGGTLHLVGSLGGRPARQLVTFGEGGPVVQSVETFPSLSSQAEPFGPTGGLIRDVSSVDGQVYYLGESRTPNTIQGTNWTEATVWDPVTGEARGLGFLHPIPESGIFGGSANGVLAVSGGNAGVMTLDGAGTLLPITDPTQGQISGALGISSDGRLIIGADQTGGGSAFWRANDIGSLDYTLFTADFLAEPDVDGLFLGAFGRMVFSDPVIGEVGLFETIDSVTFAGGIGAWDLTTGAFLRDFGLGTLADAKIFGDELVLAMNSPTGAFLTTLSDPTNLYLSDLLGPEMASFSFARGGLYEGSLGFVAFGEHNGNSVAFGTSYQFGSTAVPEPSSLALLTLGGLGAAVIRRRRARSQRANDQV